MTSGVLIYFVIEFKYMSYNKIKVKNQYIVFILTILIIGSSVFALSQTKKWVKEDLATPYTNGYVTITDGSQLLKLGLNVGGLAKTHFITVFVNETNFTSDGFSSAIGDSVNLTITNNGVKDVILRETKTNTFITIPVDGSYNGFIFVNQNIYEHYYSSQKPSFRISFFTEYVLKLVNNLGNEISYKQNCNILLKSCKSNDAYPIMPNTNGRYQAALYLKSIIPGTYTNIRKL